MDVQTDVSHVVEMLAGDQPNYFANLPLGVMASHARKSVRVNFLFPCQLGDVVEGSALRISKKSARAVFIERVEFRFAHHLFDRERASDIHAEKADVEASDLFANEQDHLPRQR